MKSIFLQLEVKLLLAFTWTNQQRLTPLIIVCSLNVEFLVCVRGVVLHWFKSYLCDHYQIMTGSVLSDAKNYCMYMLCPRALSWGQSCFHYTLLPSTKLFKTILAHVSTFIQITHSYMFSLHRSMSLRYLTG